MERMRVVEVVDGDTFIGVDAANVRRTIRLQNVDAPEIGEPGGAEAKQRLEAQILNQVVDVEVVARDSYGREVAQVWLNGVRIG